jgi:shikimate dehydrogenase
MHGNAEFEDLDWLQQVKNEVIVFDFVYNPIETAILVTAKDRRLTTIGGLRLLLLQAAASFELFTGVAPVSVEELFA